MKISAEDRKRYENAMHGVQTGVAFLMQKDTRETDPKHLRVGVNSALLEQAALASLLISKGIITSDEYENALAEMAEREQIMYEDKLKEHYGANIKAV